MAWSRVVGWIAVACVGACGPSIETGGEDDGADADSSTAGPGSTSGADGSTDPSGSVTSAEGSSTTGEAPLLPPECTCLEVVDDAIRCADSADSSCSSATICDTITVRCPRPGADLYSCASEYVYAEDALRCAITALAERTPGRFDISAATDLCGFEGCSYENRDVAITADGRAVVRACNESPFGEGSSATAVHTLADGGYFRGCMEMPSPAQQYDCMLAGLLDPIDAC